MQQTRTIRSAIVNVRKPSVTRVSGLNGPHSTIQRARPLIDPAAIAESALQASLMALARGETAGRAGFKSGLRFMQFLRAYMKAFAAGFGSYLLFTDLTGGHFNVFAMIGMHLFAIVAAPFYALAMAPTVFAMYRILSAPGLAAEMRAYAVASVLGIVLLIQRIGSGKFLLAGDFRADGLALGTLLCGVIAGYTFNRAVAQIEARAAAGNAAVSA